MRKFAAFLVASSLCFIIAEWTGLYSPVPSWSEVRSHLQRLYQQHDYTGAINLARHSLNESRKTLGPLHPDVAKLQGSLAFLFKARGRYAEAEPLYRHLLFLRQRTLGPLHPEVENSLLSLAGLCEEQGRLKEAKRYRMRALAVRSVTRGRTHPETLALLEILSDRTFFLKRYAESAVWNRILLERMEERWGTRDPRLEERLLRLARIETLRGDLARARHYLSRTLDLFSGPVSREPAALSA